MTLWDFWATSTDGMKVIEFRASSMEKAHEVIKTLNYSINEQGFVLNTISQGKIPPIYSSLGLELSPYQITDPTDEYGVEFRMIKMEDDSTLMFLKDGDRIHISKETMDTLIAFYLGL